MTDATYRSPFAIFYSSDVARAAAFYVDQLGFRESYRFPAEGAPWYVALELDGARIGIGMPPPHVSLAGGTHAAVELCIYPDDLDVAVERLRAAGVPIRQEPAQQPWGERNAYVEDPDGRPVHLASPA